MTLYDLFLVAAAVVFVTVTGFMGWSIVCRRRREGETIRLELLWWALPTLLMLLLFVLTIFSATRG